LGAVTGTGTILGRVVNIGAGTGGTATVGTEGTEIGVSAGATVAGGVETGGTATVTNESGAAGCTGAGAAGIEAGVGLAVADRWEGGTTAGDIDGTTVGGIAIVDFLA